MPLKTKPVLCSNKQYTPWYPSATETQKESLWNTKLLLHLPEHCFLTDLSTGWESYSVQQRHCVACCLLRHSCTRADKQAFLPAQSQPPCGKQAQFTPWLHLPSSLHSYWVRTVTKNTTQHSIKPGTGQDSLVWELLHEKVQIRHVQNSLW